MTAPRSDVRLEDGPMQPVDCSACGATVTARKSSWDQTSIQWNAAALAACLERRAPRTSSDRPNRQAFLGCSALAAEVRAACSDGRLEVRSHEPLKSNPEGPA